MEFGDFITEELKHKYRQRSSANLKLMEAKNNLIAYDYKTSKYIDGELTEEEFAEIKEKRKQWRKEVNENRTQLEVLNSEIKELEDEARAAYEKAIEEQYKEMYGSYEELIYE